MSTSIICENISKEYYIRHEGLRQTTFRDKIASDIYRLRSNIMNVNVKHKESNIEKFMALDNINFVIDQGDRVGIIGRNGAGKSTLLKVISRITEPTSGRISLSGRVISMLEVGTGFHPELTGRENINLYGAILGMSRKEISLKFDDIVAYAEIEKFLDTPIKRYSSGMYVRLAFSVAAHVEPDILLVDEVLAVGDYKFQQKCIGKMGEIGKQGKTVIFVSHNMALVNQLCNKGIILRQGKTMGATSVENAVSDYLSDNESSTYVHYDEGPIIEARVEQIKTNLELTVKYNVTHFFSELPIPLLGFDLKDRMGGVVFGSNQKKSLFASSKPKYPLIGEVKVIISEPKLLDGFYSVSLWFGNGTVDVFHVDDCLSINICNMGDSLQDIGKNGYVIPKCEWLME
jgi:lipopolysaccharide transport system ATP-binding protein